MKKQNIYDYLIVGAGLFGATFARLATDQGKRCLVIDKREQPGGNIRCELRDGINVHVYGAHIFHTADKEVWDFVNGYVPFNRYTNCPVAKAPDGKMYNLPFNMNTFYALWGVETPVEAYAMIERQREDALFKLNGADPKNLEEQALILVGRDIYELLIKGYTEKQWGRKCTDLPASIIRRLPVRLTFDNNYFNDPYQGIPIGGYNRLIDALLDGVDLRLGVDFLDEKNRAELTNIADKIVYTGPIDAYFGYRYGNLSWRTVRFETEVLDVPNYQGNAVINYTSGNVPYTRIIEHKHFEMFGQAVYENPRTIISREYSAEWHPGIEPYYPVNDAANTDLYERYRNLAVSERNVLFGGRLAQYRYNDMAPTIRQAMDMIKQQ